MVLVKFVIDVKNRLAIYLKQLAIFLETKKRLRSDTSQNNFLLFISLFLCKKSDDLNILL